MNVEICGGFVVYVAFYNKNKDCLRKCLVVELWFLFVKVDLVRAQLRRASKKYESMYKPVDKKLQARGSVKWIVNNDTKSMSSVDDSDAESHHHSRNRDNGVGCDSKELKNSNSCLDECSSVVHSDMEDVLASNSQDEVEIPENFLCPISFELMTNPVIVSTGQVRSSSIQFYCSVQENS